MQYMGQYGFVLIPDFETTEETISLSRELGDDNFIRFGPTATPHATLYHAKVKDVPEEFVRDMLSVLNQSLPLSLTFGSLSEYGGKLIFWNCMRTPELAHLHDTALGLSEYLEPVGKQQSEREQLTLAEDERRNVETYGHPLVGVLWQPHITLGYFNQAPPLMREEYSYNGVATRAVFAKMGEWGTVRTIVL